MSEIFKLSAGVDHLRDHEDWDVLSCFESRATYGFGLGDVDLTKVSFVPFRLTGSPVGRADLLVGTEFFLVMTPRLLRFFESLGDFPHQVIPAPLVPDRDDWRDHPPIDSTSFVVCNLHKPLHIIDFDRSDLEPIEQAPGMSRIHRLALVEGVTVPPLFRQDDWVFPSLIPRTTRDALLAAGIEDLNIRPLHGGVIILDEIKRPQ